MYTASAPLTVLETLVMALPLMLFFILPIFILPMILLMKSPSERHVYNHGLGCKHRNRIVFERRNTIRGSAPLTGERRRRTG